MSVSPCPDNGQIAIRRYSGRRASLALLSRRLRGTSAPVPSGCPDAEPGGGRASGAALIRYGLIRHWAWALLAAETGICGNATLCHAWPPPAGARPRPLKTGYSDRYCTRTARPRRSHRRARHRYSPDRRYPRHKSAAGPWSPVVDELQPLVMRSYGLALKSAATCALALGSSRRFAWYPALVCPRCALPRVCGLFVPKAGPLWTSYSRYNGSPPSYDDPSIHCRARHGSQQPRRGEGSRELSAATRRQRRCRCKAASRLVPRPDRATSPALVGRRTLGPANPAPTRKRAGTPARVSAAAL